MNNPIQKILNIHKQGQPVGIVAICSANRWVLEASMLQAKSDNSYLLIESTSNQVNQYGGYTGMTPRQFKELVLEIAQVVNFPAEKLILGGDHLGPNAWKNEKSTDALAKAESLIREYLLAGFNKIHLDTSMPCADDKIVESEPLDINIVIERIADLCLIAEDTNKERGDFYPPLYVIGSEVPIPGGAQKDLTEFEPTSVEDVKITIEKTKKVFLEKGLESAWERVIAIVVQAGVEFGDSTIVEYDRSKASELSKTVMLYDNLLYEAHSTDYQTKESLKQMVEDHFAILKVGPALTFSMREALFALAEMEIKYLAGNKTVVFSFVRELIDKAMRDNPVYWKKYYHGDDSKLAFARQFSFSDRIRYYWSNNEVSKAVDHLIRNLTSNPLPLNLISQFMPSQYEAIREGQIKNTPVDLIHHKIIEVLSNYSYATFAKSQYKILENN